MYLNKYEKRILNQRCPVDQQYSHVHALPVYHHTSQIELCSQSSSAPDGIYALGKTHNRSTQPLKSSPYFAFETVPMCVWLMMALSRPLKRIVERFLFPCSLLHTIDVVMSLALCSRVVSQAPQHFRSSETQITCDAALPSILSGHFPWPRHV